MTPNSSFHSINVPSEWGLGNLFKLQGYDHKSFHSINVPSEWGLMQLTNDNYDAIVSIQLMSPASGDITHYLISQF